METLSPATTALSPAPPAAPPAALPAAGLTRRKGLALGILALAQLMVVLDATIVNVALPSIQRALHFSSEASLQWVVNVYVLAFGGFLLLGGRVADRYGRRRVFVLGTLFFAAGSLVGGLAASPGLLIVARAAQGLGGAFMSPAALSLVTVIFAEGEERNRALGVWAAIAGAGSAIGLLAGGALTTGLSWRWVFFVNIPIGIVAALAATRVIAESRDPVAGGFDVGGAVSVTAGLGALVFGLVRANVWGWTSASTIGLFAGAAVLIGLFLALQARRRHPLVPLRLFRNRTLAGADLGMLLMGAGLFGMFFFITLYLQDIHHYSALQAGVAFLPVSAVIVVSAGLGSRALALFGPRAVLVGGLTTAAIGMALLTRISPTATYLGTLLPAMLVLAAGLGVSFVSLTSSAVSGVPQEDAGVASALLNAGQQVGGSLGLAVLTAVATARFDAARPLHPTAAAVAVATTSSWAWAFVVSAALLLAAAVITGSLVRESREPFAAPSRNGSEGVEAERGL
ncbi:MAG: MFS transporter [Acidimicrobiales bacterium]